MKMLRYHFRATTLLCGAAEFVLAFRMPPLFPRGNVQLTQSPFADYHGEQPGTMHKITVADCPNPTARNRRTTVRTS
jgi:hypothetical protein